MITTKTLKLLSIGALLGTVGLLTGCSDTETNTIERELTTATYSVTLTNTMDDTIASEVHFSPFIGVTHSSATSVWENGKTASAGTQKIAEQGAQDTISAEAEAKILAGEAQFLITGTSGVAHPSDTTDGAVTSHAKTFNVSSAYPLVSFISMIAPSPDWFVGVNSLALYENGSFKSEVTLDLVAYDAGTQDGTTFALELTDPNTDTTPQGTISRAQETAVAGKVVGTLTITKQ